MGVHVIIILYNLMHVHGNMTHELLINVQNNNAN